VQYVNTVIQLILTLALLIVGIIIAINGRWWSIHWQSNTAAVDILVRLMGVGLIIYSIYYGSCVIKDIINRKTTEGKNYKEKSKNNLTI
jgi:hypothetical protein